MEIITPSMNIQKFTSFQQLQESRYEDVFGSNFVDFVTAYKHKVKTGKIKAEQYYVQFTNYRANNIDKSMHVSPDHRDPVGVYAYPLSYVLNHPSDIWYGAGAKNLRVLKNVSRDTLRLPVINSELHMRRFLGYLNMDVGVNVKRILKDKPHILSNGNGNKWAKLFFYIVQHDITKADYPIRTGIEQSRILKREYDAIVDDSKNLKKAVVNDREPEQICFLKRSAFQIIDVVKLHGKDDIDLIYPEPPIRKLAQKIALAMDDKLITDSNETSSSGMFWTVKGRRIEIGMNTGEEARTGLKMGQKHHRHVKTFDYRYPTVTIASEYGTVAFDADYDDSYEDLAKYIRDELAKAKKLGVTDLHFKPEDKKKYNARIKQQEAEASHQRMIEARKKRMAGLKQDFSVLEQWAEMVGMPYQSSDDPDTDLMAVKLAEHTMIFLNNKQKPTASDFNEVINKVVKIDTRGNDFDTPEFHAFAQKTAELLRRVLNKFPQLTKIQGDLIRRFRFHDLRED